MKAITLTQPWATLVAIGAKRIETRSWSTNYRGPIAIHAAKTFPRIARDICHKSPFWDALEDAGLTADDLPLGAVVAIAEIRECLSTTTEWCKGPYSDSPESAFGLYASGRWMWMLENVRPCNPPIRVKGALGLWEWPEGDRLVVAS